MHQNNPLSLVYYQQLINAYAKSAQKIRDIQEKLDTFEKEYILSGTKKSMFEWDERMRRFAYELEYQELFANALKATIGQVLFARARDAWSSIKPDSSDVTMENISEQASELLSWLPQNASLSDAFNFSVNIKIEQPEGEPIFANFGVNKRVFDEDGKFSPDLMPITCEYIDADEIWSDVNGISSYKFDAKAQAHRCMNELFLKLSEMSHGNPVILKEIVPDVKGIAEQYLSMYNIDQ